MNHSIRFGNFTSSEIVALLTNGKEKGSLGAPAKTYIEEKNMERRLGRCLTSEIDARPTSWGKLLELRAFELLGTSYSLTSDRTYQHGQIPFWVGSPDGFHYNNAEPLQQAVIDFKAPYTLKSFCQLVDAWNKGGIECIRNEHKEGEKYYQQLVSNACLTGCSYAELIVYLPYKSELDDIRQMASDKGIESEFFWIWSQPDEKLPYLLDGGHYKNLNIFRFDVPVADKLALHERVVLAGKELIEVSQLVTV